MAKTNQTVSTPDINKKPHISDVYNPQYEELKALKRVYNRYYKMRESPDRRLAERQWNKSMRQWESLREEKAPDDWQSNHYVPLTQAVVEAAISEVVDISPRPLILPRGVEDEPQAEIMSHIFDYTLDISNFDLNREEILRDAFIFGTAIGQEYYFKDNRKIKVGPNGNSKVEFLEEVKADYNDVYMEPVRLTDFFVDEFARNLHKGPYRARDCVRRYTMNIDDFKLMFSGPEWDPLGNAKFVNPGGNLGFEAYFNYFQPPQGFDYSNQVEVLWYWSVKPDDWLIVVANDVVILMGPNPYKHKRLPFLRAIDVKRPHRFYGKGEAELLESIQDELNLLRRMSIDRNHLDIDKMFLVSSRLNLTDEDTIARPHGMIPVDDTDGVKPIEYGDMPRSIEISLQNLQDDATISTGINPRQQALPEASTATQAAIMKESSLKRLRLKIARFNKEFLTDLAEIRVSNILQFYPEQKMADVVGQAETQNFEDQMSQLASKGWVRTFNSATNALTMPDTKKKYRSIRLQNKEFQTDTTGAPRIVSSVKPYSFFELNPKYYFPQAGGFDIKFAAGSDIPISKPLMQAKAQETYDRLIQLAIAGVGGPKGYDPIKLGDNLLKKNDENPEDFHLDAQGQDDSGQILDQGLQLAQIENSEMMKGKDIPSTPYASVAHTQVHVQFTASPTFQQLSKNDPKVKVFLQHIIGELIAQSQRGTSPGQLPGQAQQQSGQLPQPQTINGFGPNPQQQPPSTTMSNVVPSKITGGQTQQAQFPGV